MLLLVAHRAEQIADGNDEGDRNKVHIDLLSSRF